MIRYRAGLFLPSNLCNLKSGVLIRVVPICLFVATVSAVLKALHQEVDEIRDLDLLDDFVTDSAAYTTLMGVIGFLVIFRTQQAYSRFWDSCNDLKVMQSNFFITASNLVAFVRNPNAARIEQPEVQQFCNLVIRLVSLLHAVCIMKLHNKDGDEAFIVPVIDAHGLDSESLRALAKEESKVELLCQWLQSVAVDSMSSGTCVISPPIMSRTFQNLSNGLSAFYKAYRVAEVPYPFPYLQTTEYLLVLHFILCPLLMVQWVQTWVWAFVFTFFNTFTLLSLHVISLELEDPFGADANDIDMLSMQEEMNNSLMMLLRPSTHVLPRLVDPDANLTVSDVWKALKRANSGKDDTQVDCPERE